MGCIAKRGAWGRGFAEFRSEFNGQTGPFPAHIFEAAEKVFAELVASTDTQVVLHGDLHHWNICSTQREPWLAKQSVVLPVETYEEMLEDIRDLVAIAERKDEKSVSLDDVIKNLKSNGLL